MTASVLEASMTSESFSRASLTLIAEPVKAFETEAQDFFCGSVWMVGLLIQATVGSLGGVGRRPQKR